MKKFNFFKSEVYMNYEKVSIILCVYNGEKYIKESITSLLNQTYSNIEIIVCDDGSTDQTSNIVNEILLYDDRVFYFYKKNSGLTKSLNFALNKCSGEWIARQDADDISFPNRILMQLEFCKKFNLDFSTSLVQRFNEFGIIDIQPKIPKEKAFKIDVLKYGNVHIHGTFFVKKSILEKYKYDENYIYAQDYNLLIRLLVNNIKCGMLDEVLYKLRIHENSISSKKRSEQCQSVISTLKSCNISTVFYIEQYSWIKKLKFKIQKKVEITFI